MSVTLDTVLILFLLTVILTLASSRIVSCIRLVAAQGAMLGLLPLVAHETIGMRLWFLAVATSAIKGWILPWLLLKARREANVPREVEPFVGFGSSILVGLAMLAISFWMVSQLPVPEHMSSSLAMPISFFGIFSGLFLVISRRKAIMQALGYLVLENGIFIFGVIFVSNQPIVVEMGVLLDLFVGVFVMGIAIFHISREFDHIDADRLSELRDITIGKTIEKDAAR